VAPLYGCVDSAAYGTATPQPQYRAALSYIGTYAADRQPRLAELFIEPARQLPEERFVIAGAQYPENFPWVENVHFVQHLPPGEHPAFYASSRLTLNVTRDAMARLGYCPSGRLFEAAACGAAIISDEWPGLEHFFEPGVEILIARTRADVLAALRRSDNELRRLASAARARVLEAHSAAKRAEELETLVESAMSQSLEV
jgi:spore maturation protein CgeB